MNKLALGMMVTLGSEPEKEFAAVRDIGLAFCQLVSWSPMEVSEQLAMRTRAAAMDAGVSISLFWCGYSGPAEWNFLHGPATIGLVPPTFRAQRTIELKRGIEIAHLLGVSDMATHVGFLPVDAQDANYLGVVAALQQVVAHGSELGVTFDFETGQETPITLLRCIQDVGMSHVGINLDPANLLMYGNGNPLDALDVFGQYVRGVHAKDGEYPTDGYALGNERTLGEGRVNFPALLGKLKSLGYTGSLTIEREISGEQQIADIKRAMELLAPLC